MTTAELLVALALECPNGVSFDTLAVRLLRQRIPLDDRLIENLKAEMLQLERGLWFSREMILDDKPRLELRERASEWLEAYGFFSIERLYELYRADLRHIYSLDSFSGFLKLLGFTVIRWERKSLFGCRLNTNLRERLGAASRTITSQLEESSGTLPLSQIEMVMPHLSSEALESIRLGFLPEVRIVEIGGATCWHTTESISLPIDFQEKLTTAIDTLIILGEKVSANNLGFALSLLYRVHFRKEYALTENSTFLHICAENYRGEKSIFKQFKEAKAKKRKPQKGRKEKIKRTRGPNTRFEDLSVPVGAKLTFVRVPSVYCVVLDDTNQVEYENKAWSISTLAKHLLGTTAANGFALFSYEGEALLDRRSRLGSNGGADV